MKVTKKAYLHGFTFIVLLLGAIRLFTNIGNSQPSTLASNESETTEATASASESKATEATEGEATEATEGEATVHDDSVIVPQAVEPESEANESKASAPQASPSDFTFKGKKLHKFNWDYAVANYDAAFPDMQDVQLIAAQKYGVKPVANRAEAEKRKNELVYVSANPYFVVDKLHSSIPYLVPRASVLLQDIGKAYYDSLTMKSIPLHTIIVTSILRSKEDVAKLRTHNTNATENSCHLYGTTFDIAQNRFVTVEDPEGPHRRAVTNDTLKWVLSEVLRDMRQQGRCYIKYEKHQGCFHISVR